MKKQRWSLTLVERTDRPTNPKIATEICEIAILISQKPSSDRKTETTVQIVHENFTRVLGDTCVKLDRNDPRYILLRRINFMQSERELSLRDLQKINDNLVEYQRGAFIKSFKNFENILNF